MDKPCIRCGKCCLRSPCSIPVQHIEALRKLVTGLGKPADIDVVKILFRYEEEVLEDGRISGFFMPLGKILNNGSRCMWLKKNTNKTYTCTLFWNAMSDILYGFAEQVVGKGKGCTYDSPVGKGIIPMVYRDNKLMLARKT